MKRIALTGGIATGKSHVLAVFKALGVPTIDADVLAHEVVAPGSAGLAAVVSRFGPDVLDGHGGVDRRKLAAIVFADPAARRDLEAIVHPTVVAAIEQWFASLDPSTPFAIADIPLLFETDRTREYDVVVVTACDPETQVRRTMARDGSSEAEARQRIGAQIPVAEKARQAHHVINTDGSVAETNKQVRALYELLQRP
jgi:dephospho-CoA kinase